MAAQTHLKYFAGEEILKYTTDGGATYFDVAVKQKVGNKDVWYFNNASYLNEYYLSTALNFHPNNQTIYVAGNGVHYMLMDAQGNPSTNGTLTGIGYDENGEPVAKNRAAVKSYQDWYDKAKADNDAITDANLAQAQEAYKRWMGGEDDPGALSTLGDQQRADLYTQYQNADAKMGQNLIDRGLTGTTILPTMLQSNERKHQEAIGRLNEQLTRERAEWDVKLGQGVTEARNQGLSAYPDLSQMWNMMF